MSENWRNILVRFRPTIQKAEAILCTSQGRNLVGLHQISFKTLTIKFLEDLEEEDEKIVYLCCNLINHMQKKPDGSVKWTDSAISLIHLKAGKTDDLRTFPLEGHPHFQFSDKNVIHCWLKEITGDPIDHKKIEINVLCSYSKINNERRILSQPGAST